MVKKFMISYEESVFTDIAPLMNEGTIGLQLQGACNLTISQISIEMSTKLHCTPFDVHCPKVT